MTSNEYCYALDAERHIKCVLDEYIDLFPDEIDAFLTEIRLKIMRETED